MMRVLSGLAVAGFLSTALLAHSSRLREEDRGGEVHPDGRRRPGREGREEGRER